MMATAAEEICHSSPNSENYITSVSFKITRKNQDRPWTLRFIYLQCYFISVATILGTGILGLPVTIAQAGLLPFLVSFVIGFFIQGLLIYLFVDLLQRCRVVQMESLKSSETERILMQDVGLEEPAPTNIEMEEDEEDGEEPDRDLLQRDTSVSNLEGLLGPSLHSLGVLFLNKYMSHAFNFILLFQFISVGISYALAGSEAYAELLHVRHIYVIPVFTWILSLGILLAQIVIQPITSLLTLLKGTLLIVTVAVTFTVGSEVHQEMTNDFSQIGKPFLMGTVALGGIVNVMPFLFSEISHNKSQIMWFRRVVLGGLVTCTVLNILWCWAVLEIVPQMSVKKVLEDGISNNSGIFTETSPPAYTFVYSNISLEESERVGEIATIPLTKIINQKHRHFSWVVKLIQIFIAISITVSFLVMGSAMKHTIDGLVNALLDGNAEGMCRNSGKSLPRFLQRCNSRRLVNGFMSLLAFGLIFLVASCDPKGFVVMLDKVVSFSLNTEMGLFIFLMMRTSRSEPFRHLSVPLPMGERLFRLHWVLPLYFLFAVGYDVFTSLMEVAESFIQTQSQSTNSSLH
ncbi:uncharacterized protein si:ch211-51h4.2 isoform X2 [Megalops cyprinoides]|uniref:uncharacterized protein si:ch211-51h4.2 isoform X2 n=1 Tax=Megalops cyprinoides TaxID=118141 RepID=UPI0018645E99|nr:uncharacterized protein si:ch211-51h4.2 isoform X2 [Megalops cyprinoides]